MAARNLARSVERVYSNPFRLMFSSKFQQQDEGVYRLNCVYEVGKSSDVPSRCETSPFLDKASESSTAGFHFPSLRSAIEGHGFYCDVNRFSPRSTPSLVWDGQLQTNMHRLGMGSSLFLYEKELQYHDAIPGQLWWITNSNYLPTIAEVDEVSLPSQNESTNSPMLMNTKRTFNPSTLVRKRRHGFLARHGSRLVEKGSWRCTVHKEAAYLPQMSIKVMAELGEGL